MNIYIYVYIYMYIYIDIYNTRMPVSPILHLYEISCERVFEGFISWCLRLKFGEVVAEIFRRFRPREA